MCRKISENFRNKLTEVARKLGADVANNSSIVLKYLIEFPTSQEKIIRLNPVSDTSDTITPDGQVKLSRQDVFLAEKISYYLETRQIVNGSYTAVGHAFCSADAIEPNISWTGLYRGVISYLQKKTMVGSNILLSKFVHRNFSGNISGVKNTEFDVDLISSELNPYWLISGDRDNEILIEYAQSVNNAFDGNMTAFVTFVCVQLDGVLLPNTSKNLK